MTNCSTRSGEKVSNKVGSLTSSGFTSNTSAIINLLTNQPRRRHAHVMDALQNVTHALHHALESLHHGFEFFHGNLFAAFAFSGSASLTTLTSATAGSAGSATIDHATYCSADLAAK